MRDVKCCDLTEAQVTYTEYNIASLYTSAVGAKNPLRRVIRRNQMHLRTIRSTGHVPTFNQLY